MSDVTVARRRVKALEDALAILKKEWGETAESGVLSHYMDQVSVDAKPHATIEEGQAPGWWLNIVAVVGILEEMQAEQEAMMGYAENYAMSAEEPTP